MLRQVRHRIVKLIAPKVFLGHQIHKQVVQRPMIKFLEKRNGKGLIGAEIGVSDGFNAKRILSSLDVKTLYLVDPYLKYIDGDDRKADCGAKKQLAEKRLKPFENKTVFIHKLSSEAVDLLPDNLDFVYIDANHNYEYVKADVAAYFKKVKSGGVLGGHDFFGKLQGVVWAVIEFAQKENLKLYSDVLDWWVIKPD